VVTRRAPVWLPLWTRRLELIGASILAICLGGPLLVPGVTATEGIFSTLGDKDFWTLVLELSEQAGTFQSDNLVSNEPRFQDVIPDLTRIAKPDGIYVGVGPEQNFTYIAALKPKMAFIVDIRRGNLTLHLMYKALFELSADRADFVSRLFGRKRPDGLSAKSTVTEIFDAYAEVETSEALYAENMRAIVNHLTKKHGFALSGADVQRLLHTYAAFHSYGPGLRYSSTGFGGRRTDPTYRDLMLASDAGGQVRSYLATEESFAFLKNFQAANLLVPVIGNFAGPRTIRAVGSYLSDKGTAVSAFYVSNVEEYLRRDGIWQKFCANVAMLPFNDTSLFIRSVRNETPTVGLKSELGAMAAEVPACNPN
jgi:hypothetical protein